MKRVAVLGCMLALVLADACRADVRITDPRIAPLAAALRTAPLAIDPDLSWVLSPAQRRTVVRVLGRAQVPFHVALISQDLTDGSGGDAIRIAAELHTALHRPGLYVAIDEDGTGSVDGYDLDRDPIGLEMPEVSSEPAAGEQVVAVLSTLVRDADKLPADGTGNTGFDRDLDPIEPATYPVHHTPAGVRVLSGFGIAFAVSLSLSLLLALIVRRRRRRSAR